jgi:hypothetical protein
VEQFEAFAPGKLEHVGGYLIGGPESREARVQLLALLLTNCGLEAAAMLTNRHDWREAAERAWFDFYEGIR